ncbi:hypothetical protein DNTS_014427 [Danionella cerebrum]|uniref:FBX41/ZN365 C2H2-type zinc finger domain-containing protein n=1 Tax=Danionella cerebrum TaxID=2873325 RepID=A0A553MXN4_9TELE|nr:hypothetical protein DNTS_014427 [Danionella translucida]
MMWSFIVMQQKVCTRSTALFVKNSQACGAGANSQQLPYRCPRCGEHQRFHTLSSLRSHLEHSHPFSLLINPDQLETLKITKPDAVNAGPHKQTHQKPIEKSLSIGEMSVEKRLEGMMRTANTSMERRLLRLSSELAQTDTAIQCERAHSHHLAQEKQEVLERERALSRQVDAAVTVIATLRQQLSISEHELERREQEVLTIQKFLEAAAQHEMCGKVRLRRFIESLLRRISLAERLLESSEEHLEGNKERQLFLRRGQSRGSAVGRRCDDWCLRRMSDGY